MTSILHWFCRGRAARARSRERRNRLERIVAAREAHLDALEEAVARTCDQLGMVVPDGPDGGLVYRARMRLVALRADAAWVRAVQRAEYEVAVAPGSGRGAPADEMLDALTDRVADVKTTVAEEVVVLGGVLAAGAAAISNAAALEHVDPGTMANMVLFVPELAEDFFAVQGDMKNACDDAIGRAAVVLERRTGHLRLCCDLPHRRRLSGRVRAHVESAAAPVDCGSIVAIDGAHRAVCVAMTEIHAEQFGSRRR